jgi:hypothetical protein
MRIGTAFGRRVANLLQAAVQEYPEVLANFITGQWQRWIVCEFLHHCTNEPPQLRVSLSAIG